MVRQRRRRTRWRSFKTAWKSFETKPRITRITDKSSSNLRYPRQKGSELQTQLTLEHAVSGLCRDLSPRHGGARGQVGINRQVRVAGLRMVQHVERVRAELQALRFRDSERFGEICIESPNRKHFKNVL